MGVYEIISCYGDFVEHIRANNARQALCMYLMNHEEMNDAILWKSPSGLWKLAEYDNEEQYIFARRTFES